ncbi:endonuclease/exonuclease/phosphatase family protein [bacterium SCSIO 12741]|nr:endonuclease/exonuclease/phosphatase family protein [bacterium SCSIO 12741]
MFGLRSYKPTKKLGWFFRMCLFIWVFATILVLVGRDTLILGTALILGRPLWIIGGVFWSWFIDRRLVSRPLKRVVWLLLALLLLEYSWVGINRESLGEPATPKTEISIITYNLFFKNKAPQQSLSILEQAQADVLFLQEITPQWYAILEKKLSKSHPYRVVLPYRGTHGLAVYSRFPLKQIKVMNNDSKLPFAQWVSLEVAGRKLLAVHAHLASPAVAVENPDRFFPLIHKNHQLRIEQLNQIQEQAILWEPDYSSIFLIGDLNTTPHEPIYRQLTDDWVDGFEEAGSGNPDNFPNSSHLPAITRLDYVMAKGELQFQKVQVFKGGSSDHLALKARVAL